MTHKIILASKSPRRAEILRLLGLDFEVAQAAADERLDDFSNPREVGRTLALRKAHAAKALLEKQNRLSENHVIIAADTLVYLSGTPLGKPRDERDAFDMLRSLSGRTHTVCTGQAIICGGEIADADLTKVTMRKFSDEEILKYISTGEPLDKAGAYGVQGMGALLIEKIEGSFFSVMGLCPTLLYGEAKELGINLFDEITQDKDGQTI